MMYAAFTPYNDFTTQKTTPISKATAPATAFVLGAALLFSGSGSVFDFLQATKWQKVVEARTAISVDVKQTTEIAPTDLRTPTEHLSNIKEVLNPAISNLATVFGVSRQAIYKWMNSESTPEPENLQRIVALSHAADSFHNAGITNAATLLKIKAFDGLSLLDLVAADQLLPAHIDSLIAEAHAMDAAYDRSGLAQSKAKPSDDWRSEVSIPGTLG